MPFRVSSEETDPGGCKNLVCVSLQDKISQGHIFHLTVEIFKNLAAGKGMKQDILSSSLPVWTRGFPACLSTGFVICCGKLADG